MEGSSMAGERLRDLFRSIACAGGPIVALLLATPAVAQDQPEAVFVTSDKCIACHSNMVDANGEALSIGHTWRASLMALSAKDPYWQAAVRREIADRPQMQDQIEDICSVCHMPIFRTTAVTDGRSGELIRYLEGGFSPQEHKVAADGVSCTVCHQISAENFGQHGSFDGGYVITPSLPGQGKVFGPYKVAAGLQQIMQSASAFVPGEGAHIQRSELCATCHTLFTPATDGDGQIIGEFAEQVPYLEWKHSAYQETRSCQDCHMPEVEVPVPISSVLGEPRENVSRHVFRGGNVFMLKMLNRYRNELGVTTPAADLEESTQATLDHLQSAAAQVSIAGVGISGSEAVIEIKVSNQAGHKLPTAYPSRRAWLHLTVRDQSGRTIFESGALNADGSIVGNDNDADPDAYEPHYREISSADQVQLYEPIIHDYKNDVTTSLLSGAAYAKDNRLLPLGFDKATADDAVGVRGVAADDDDFRDGGDSIRYRVPLPDDGRPIVVSAELLYQTIGYRWARNLEAYDSHETNRFVGYYEENAATSAVVLAEARVQSHADRSAH
jgi:hypothetical protein